MIEPRTRMWWRFLKGVSVLNLALFGGVAFTVDLALPYRVPHLILAGIYTAVCAFRSFFPRVDLERTVMVDHWLSSIVLGRTSATIAEMCFTAQLSLVLFELSPTVSWFYPIGIGILPLIALAQAACWYGVLSGNHLWHAVEEILWTIMVITMAVAGIGLWSHVEGLMSGFLIVGWVGCVGTVYVMSGLDVPMYLRRWRHEKAAGATFRGALEGFADAWSRREPTGAWSVWRHEVAWMTPYFSVGVWLSLLLAKVSV